MLLNLNRDIHSKRNQRSQEENGLGTMSYRHIKMVKDSEVVGEFNPLELKKSFLMAPTCSSSRVRVHSSPNPKPYFSMRISSSIRHKICPICLDHIKDSKAAVLPPCLHAYCVDCIRKWSQVKRNCPLCNAQFTSIFTKIRLSSGKFEEERLPILDESKKIDFRDRFSRPRQLRRLLNEARGSNQQSRPLPRRRSFGRSGYVPYGERERHEADIAERVLRWRASIYSGRMQAVPLPARKCQEQNILGNNFLKHRMQQRIEPWIRRELQAVLGDPDPLVIVHLATALYISSVEEKLKASSDSECGSVEDKYVEQLRPFLQDNTNMFWHEMRCYAESSVAMTT